MTEPEINTIKARAESWEDGNPFKASLLTRLGGLHRPAPTDRGSEAEEARIDHAREVAEALSTPATEF